MEFGIFMNGYLPGPAAHDTESEHTMLMREIEYAIHADQFNWKYLWFGEHHSLDRVQPHVGARGRHRLRRRPHRAHPHGLGDHEPLAPGQPPGPRRRARGDDRPHHRQPLRVGHRPRRRQPRDRRRSTSWTRTPPRPSGKRSSRRSRACGSRRTTSSTATTSRCPYPHNILPKPYGKGHPPIWMACGNPPSFGRAGELGLGAIAFNFEPIFNLKGRLRRLQGGDRATAPSRSASSRTTTS